MGRYYDEQGTFRICVTLSGCRVGLGMCVGFQKANFKLLATVRVLKVETKNIYSREIRRADQP